MAWQLRRDLRLQAPGAVQQVFFVFFGSLSEAKPSRTMTWQVVQAQLMSQACSMLMWLSSSASQMEVPAGADISAPWGQYSGCGQDLDDGHGAGSAGGMGPQSSVFSTFLPASALLDAVVHALRGKGLGALGQRLRWRLR
jgi:hypothetical protein